jgi:predicted nucleic acid-binding protein
MIFSLPYTPNPKGTPVFVLGVDVTVAWRVLVPGVTYPSEVLGRMTHAIAAVPGSWFLDVAELLRSAIRTKRLTVADAENFLMGLQSFAIWVDDETPLRAWAETFELARRHRISTGAAAYLELALRLNLPIATTDATLTRVATAAGAPVFTP